MVLDKSQRTEEKCNNEKFIDYVQYNNVQLLFAKKELRNEEQSIILKTVKIQA